MKNSSPCLNAIQKSAFTLGILLSIAYGPFGCATSHGDPLAGWKPDFAPHLDPAIEMDCQDYIKNLSPNKRNGAAIGGYFEDGTGQHAVTIGVSLRNGTDWSHVLIYDKENRRVRVIKYVSGHHQS